MEYVDTQADIAVIAETADAFGTRIRNLERDLNNRRDALVASRKPDLERAEVV